MTFDLITMPLRVSMRTAQIALRAAGHVTDRALGVANVVAGIAKGANSRPHDVSGSASTPPVSANPVSASPAPASRSNSGPAPPTVHRSDSTITPARPGDRTIDGPAARERSVIAVEAVHVTEESVLVRESAEPGAEDGAGAQVKVAAPWSGYDRIKAADLIARLAGASSAELAAVQLYESANRRRETVITAVERELQRVTPSSSIN